MRLFQSHRVRSNLLSAAFHAALLAFFSVPHDLTTPSRRSLLVALEPGKSSHPDASREAPESSSAEVTGSETRLRPRWNLCREEWEGLRLSGFLGTRMRKI